MSSLVRRLLVFGAPGSGKGTISSRIQKDFVAQQISTGDLLRQHIEKGTSLGKQADSVLKAGGLVDDKLMIDLVENELKQIENKSWLLDGFPRTLTQAQALDLSCQRQNQPLHAVLFLDVPFDVILERIRGRFVHLPSGRVYNLDYNPPKVHGKDDVTGEPLSKRPDDNEETMKTRLQRFKDTSDPILHHYGKKGLVKRFSGSTSDEIYKHLKPELASLWKQ